MAEADESTPVKRGPGRPRKTQEEPTKPEVKTDSVDPRIGTPVADERWHHVSFPDGSEYRVEDGVIVEKV